MTTEKAPARPRSASAPLAPSPARGHGDPHDHLLSDPWLPWAVRLLPGSEGTRAEAKHQRLDDVVVVDRSSGPVSGVRGKRQIAATRGDHLVVRIVRSGEETFGQDGREWTLRPGDAVVWESDRPARFAAAGDVVTRSLVVPRKVLHEVGCPLTASAPVAGRVPAVHLLTAYLDVLDATLPALSGAAEVGARNALLELVWGALRPRTALDPLALKPARWAAVERYLDTRLGRGDLSAQEVAAAHGISVRTLGRLFAENGGTFTGVVRAKRIARVREDLLTGDDTVEALARRWGFFDTSHLNRGFRAVHATSPQEYRLLQRDAGAGRPTRTP
jgi:AraC-like DNA-binding protein